MKLKLVLLLIVISGGIFLLFKPTPARAAGPCTGQTYTAGQTCTGTGNYYGGAARHTTGTARVRIDPPNNPAREIDVTHTLGYVCQGPQNGRWTITVLEGSARLWIADSFCGNTDDDDDDDDDDPPEPQPSFTLNCRTTGANSIRWSASWRNAAKPGQDYIELRRGSTVIHRFRGSTDSNSPGNGAYEERGLQPNTNYGGRLNWGGTNTSATDTCRTDRGATANISCSSQPGFIRVNWTSANAPGEKDIFRNGTLWENNVTANGSKDDHESLTPTTYQFVQYRNDGSAIVRDEVTGCTPGAVANPSRPFVSTVFPGQDTYGDIHAGGLSKFSAGGVAACGAPKNWPGYKIIGSSGSSAVSSVVSAIGTIAGFGSSGNPASRAMNVGSGGGYKFPICRPFLHAAVNAFTRKVPHNHSNFPRTKNFHISHSVDGKYTVAYFGGRERNDKVACDQTDVDRPGGGRNSIKELLEWDTTREVLIYCDVSWYGDLKNDPFCGDNGCIPRRSREVRNERIALPSMTVRGRKTLFILTRKQIHDGVYGHHSKIDRGYAIRLNGNITYPALGPAGATGLNALSSFGIISGGGITIHGRVSELNGFFFGGAQPFKRGTVATCHRNPKAGQGVSERRANTRACNNKLVVQGALWGGNMLFRRTGIGPVGTAPPISGGPRMVEQIGGPGFGLMAIGASPPAFQLTTNDCGDSDGDGDTDECELLFEEIERPPIF